MSVVRYEPALHAQIIDAWLEARGMAALSATLPEIGFIASVENEMAAASFMRMVEGGYCLFDGLVTNPALAPFKRNLAIDAVVRALLEKSQELKLSKVLAYTLDEGTLRRSIRHGFMLLPHRLIVKELA